MTNRKGQNSILFLTTLGVYLGLMLVGASPQIIAQRAATTRNFDIRDEIEFKDDLDKKPGDGDRSPITDSVSVYLQDVEQLLAALGGLNRKGQFDTSTSPFEVSQTVFLPCEASNTAGSYTARKFDNTNAAIKPFLERFSKALTYGYSLGDCLKTPVYQDKDAVASAFLFKLDDQAFSVELCIKKSSPLSASTLLAALPATFKSLHTENASVVRQALIDSTRVSKGSDQVFIVTRLPRGSIDTLLAQDVK